MKNYPCKCGAGLILVRVGDLETIVAQYQTYEFRCSASCGRKYAGLLNDSMERYPAGYNYIKGEWIK